MATQLSPAEIALIAVSVWIVVLIVGGAAGLLVYLEKRRRRRHPNRGSDADGPTLPGAGTNGGNFIYGVGGAAVQFDAISNAPSDPGSAQSIQAQLDLLKPHLLSFKAMLWDLEKWIDTKSRVSPGSMVTEYLEARGRLKQVLLLLEEQAECPADQGPKVAQMLDWSERCLKRFLVNNKTYGSATAAMAAVTSATSTKGVHGRGGGGVSRRLKRSHSAPRPTLPHVAAREPGFVLLGFNNVNGVGSFASGGGGGGGHSGRRRLPQRGAMFLPDSGDGSSGGGGRFTINRRLAPISENPPRRSVSLSGLFDREMSTPL